MHPEAESPLILFSSSLTGFQSKLDYIMDLGVKGVALSSILKVPAGGSDEAVEDFQDIDPRYGSLAEFKALVASLKNRGKCFYLLVPC
jgi:glycosidase